MKKCDFNNKYLNQDNYINTRVNNFIYLNLIKI